jgi:hypothetical protein
MILRAARKPASLDRDRTTISGDRRLEFEAAQMTPIGAHLWTLTIPSG